MYLPSSSYCGPRPAAQLAIAGPPVPVVDAAIDAAAQRYRDWVDGVDRLNTEANPAGDSPAGTGAGASSSPAAPPAGNSKPRTGSATVSTSQVVVYPYCSPFGQHILPEPETAGCGDYLTGMPNRLADIPVPRGPSDPVNAKCADQRREAAAKGKFLKSKWSPMALMRPENPLGERLEDGSVRAPDGTIIPAFAADPRGRNILYECGGLLAPWGKHPDCVDDTCPPEGGLAGLGAQDSSPNLCLISLVALGIGAFLLRRRH